MGNPDRISSVCESLHPWLALHCSHPKKSTICNFHLTIVCTYAVLHTRQFMIVCTPSDSCYTTMEIATQTHAQTHVHAHSSPYGAVQNGIIFHDTSVSTWQQRQFPYKDEYQQNPPNKLVHPSSGPTFHLSTTCQPQHQVSLCSPHYSVGWGQD